LEIRKLIMVSNIMSVFLYLTEVPFDQDKYNDPHKINIMIHIR
jgi:hypothetical protein